MSFSAFEMLPCSNVRYFHIAMALHSTLVFCAIDETQQLYRKILNVLRIYSVSAAQFQHNHEGPWNALEVLRGIVIKEVYKRRLPRNPSWEEYRISTAI
jgi:hypothetical protein